MAAIGPRLRKISPTVAFEPRITPGFFFRMYADRLILGAGMRKFEKPELDAAGRNTRRLMPHGSVGRL